MNQNPLLTESRLPFGAIPFDQLKTEHYLPAFDQALDEARGNIEAIKAASASADFDNTLNRLEAASEKLDLVAGVFSNLLHAHTNPELQALAKEIMPKLAAFSNDVYLDEKLFERVRKVYDSRKEKGVTGEDLQLLEKTYKAFVRNGALLTESGKNRLREIDARLSVIQEQFSENVLKATHAYELVLTRKEDLAGLPDSAVEAAAAAAKERGKEGAWVFTLDFPSYMPFMKFSERRELREKLWKAYSSRAMTGDVDNRGLAREITRLRFERARLLGYATHAHFVLEERMAANPERARGFLERLLKFSRKGAEQDLEELKRFSQLPDLRQWDFTFYSEKLKQRKFDFNEEELRPYFSLEKVVEGVFEHARRLYGIEFKARGDIPAYHPDVQVYEVRDVARGEFVGLFYADFFPRPSKQGGAWMTSYRDQGQFGGKVQRPHVSIVCNLTKPTPTKPSLLNLVEVRTVFHEFGHSLHMLLSRCHHRSLAGTNVYWDFVELPSQIMENWIKEKEGLDLFACHYQTGEGIPAEWVAKIQESAKFQAGTQSLRQLSFGFLDFGWHAGDPSQIQDVEAFEAEVLKETTLLPRVPGTSVSCAFTHIFSGGYSAGYYSYKWAEVLDADAFEFFREKGIFDPEVAGRFKSHILERGGTEHPMELYKKFRGREPDPDALLRRDGLLA